MTVYVERKGGVVTGVYANPQKGYAEEVAAEDDPEVVAFLAVPVAMADAERDKQSALVAQVGEIIADLAAYKALTNPSGSARKQFENRVCDVLAALLKRITHRD